MEKAADEEDTSQHEGDRDPRDTDTTITESYYTEAVRVSGLHDLLSHHHRPNG